MARTSQIRYFDSRNAYYTQWHGKQTCLAAGPKDEPEGPTYKAAVLRFSQLMNSHSVGNAEDESAVSTVIVRYYHHLIRSGKDTSLKFIRKMLDSAIAAFGHLKMQELKPCHVNDWLDKMRVSRPGKTRRKGWNDTSCVTAWGHLGGAINWAVSEQLITKNPVKAMKFAFKSKVRGESYILPTPLMEILIGTAGTEFGLVLRLLRATGARPGEIFHAECSHYSPEIGAIVYRANATEGYIWKNARKTGKDRVIFIPADLQAEVEALIAKRGKGYIFRTPRRKVWNNANVSETIRTLRKRPEVNKWLADNDHSAKNVILYGFRHTYITSWLKAGKSINVVADLCGTSVKMIEKHYSHLCNDLPSLRGQALSFTA